MKKKELTVKEQTEVYRKQYESKTLSELHQKSLEIANDKLKYFPDTWKSHLTQSLEYKTICKIIKEKRNG